jgi:hypothetical protein
MRGSHARNGFRAAATQAIFPSPAPTRIFPRSAEEKEKPDGFSHVDDGRRRGDADGERLQDEHFELSTPGLRPRSGGDGAGAAGVPCPGGSGGAASRADSRGAALIGN